MDLTLFFVDSLRKLLSTDITDFDFVRIISHLRKMLCCTVCGNLLSEEPLLVPDKSNHFICRSCVSDWKKYESDPTLSCFVATYKAFCEFILRSDDMRRLSPESCLFEIVKEGSLRDILDEEELVFQNSIGVQNDNNPNQNESEENVNDTLNSNSVWIKSEPDTSPLHTSKSPDAEPEFRFRKQTWSETSAQTLDLLASGSSNESSQKLSILGSVVRTDEATSPVKKLKVRLPKQKTPPKIRRGCRCGNATLTRKITIMQAAVPGKLTCCGQRCPCYVDARACFECRCKGCRNPHLPGGKKLLQGINTVIDTKSNLAVQLPTSSSSASPTQLFSTAGGSSFSSIYHSVGNFTSFSLPALPIISVSQQHSDQKPLY